MKEFTAQEIQAQFEKLPKEVQDAVTSPEVKGLIEGIGKKNNLLIDQMGELVDEIGLVMLGLRKSSDFVSDVSSRLSIGRQEAENIAKDVHEEIFASIKEHLMKIDGTRTEKFVAEAPVDHSSLEKAGGFSIIHKGDTPEHLPGEEEVTESSHEILSEIENLQIKRADVSSKGGTHVDPIIDHLLSRPVSNAQEKIVKKPEGIANPAPAEPKTPPKTSYAADPYHEPIQ